MGIRQRTRRLLLAFVDLVRIRITGMVLVACCIGYLLASQGNLDFPRLVFTLTGTALLSGGACTLNCYIERKEDALMPRTCRRPLPAGVIAASTALIFGIALIAAGALLLLAAANALTCLIGLAAVFIYLALYTPAKSLTWINTSIGALPGAVPPLIGWAAVRGQLAPAAWVLFAMLFLWQHVHFLPIAWLFRNDYRKAGFKMLPVLEDKGQKTFSLTVLSSLILLPTTMLLGTFKLTGPGYLICAGCSSLLLLVSGIKLSNNPTPEAARRVLYLSLCYLPLILAAVVLDRYGAEFGLKLHGWWLLTMAQETIK